MAVGRVGLKPGAGFIWRGSQAYAETRRTKMPKSRMNERKTAGAVVCSLWRAVRTRRAGATAGTTKNTPESAEVGASSLLLSQTKVNNASGRLTQSVRE
jgi:hypothetical protein